MIRPGGYQSIADLVLPTGRLHKQMSLCYDKINAIDGISCVRPKGALYCFPKINLKKFNFEDDDGFVLNLLEQKHILVVAGNGFNYPTKDHFRIVFLPPTDILGNAVDNISDFLEHSRK